MGEEGTDAAKPDEKSLRLVKIREHKRSSVVEGGAHDPPLSTGFLLLSERELVGCQISRYLGFPYVLFLQPNNKHGRGNKAFPSGRGVKGYAKDGCP